MIHYIYLYSVMLYPHDLNIYNKPLNINQNHTIGPHRDWWSILPVPSAHPRDRQDVETPEPTRHVHRAGHLWPSFFCSAVVVSLGVKKSGSSGGEGRGGQSCFFLVHMHTCTCTCSFCCSFHHDHNFLAYEFRPSNLPSPKKETRSFMACRASFTKTTAAQAIKEPWFFSTRFGLVGPQNWGIAAVGCGKSQLSVNKYLTNREHIWKIEIIPYLSGWFLGVYFHKIDFD